MHKTLTIIIVIALILAVIVAIFVLIPILIPSAEMGLGDVFGLPSGESPPALPG